MDRTLYPGKKSVQNENASVEQWQIISLSILNKASVMETMWTISKRVHEVVFGTGALGSQLLVLAQCGPVKYAHINGSFISHLVVRFSLVFSFTSGFWKQHRVDLGTETKTRENTVSEAEMAPVEGITGI